MRAQAEDRRRPQPALDPPIERNVEALKAVQPADLLPGDISARLGSSWIPASDIRDFIAELLDIAQARRHASAIRGAIATWTRRARQLREIQRQQHDDPRHARASRASDLIEDALNGRTPTVYDQIDKDTRVINQQETIAAREKQQQLKDRFREWIWEDEDARRSGWPATTTTRFNNLRLRTFDGSHLTFPGMNRTMLRDERSRQAPEGRRLADRCRATARCWRMSSARARPGR